MTEPIIFVIHEQAGTLAAVVGALERRFGADYRILADGCPTSALARLARACDGRSEVALVVAGVSTSETNGLDWLARVRDLCPMASRCALVSYGDGATYPVVRRALVLGQLETFVM